MMSKLNDFVFLLVAWSMFCAMPACAMPGAMPQPRWRPDGEALECGACGAEFSLLRRRHHCAAAAAASSATRAPRRASACCGSTRRRACASARARAARAARERVRGAALPAAARRRRLREAPRLLGRERRVELILSPDRRHLRYRVLSASPAGAAAADVKRILLDNVAPLRSRRRRARCSRDALGTQLRRRVRGRLRAAGRALATRAARDPRGRARRGRVAAGAPAAAAAAPAATAASRRPRAELTATPRLRRPRARKSRSFFRRRSS